MRDDSHHKQLREHFQHQGGRGKENHKCKTTGLPQPLEDKTLGHEYNVSGKMSATEGTKEKVLAKDKLEKRSASSPRAQ